MNARSRAVAVVLAVASHACDGAGPASTSNGTAKGSLPPGVVARVGQREIETDRVVRIARAQHESAQVALEAAVRDALLVREAEARGLAETPGVRVASEIELARRVLGRLLATARATPPTAEELQAAADRRWLEVARPEGFRTVHAVAMFTPTDPEEKKARGRALASELRNAVSAAVERALATPMADPAVQTGPRIGPQNDPDPVSFAFRAAAMAVPGGGIEVRVEPLPAVAADGRVLEPGEQYLAKEFAAAAAALRERGSVSPVVETPFGAHVIVLLERTPARALTGEARVARLRDDIVNERARAAQKKLLERRGAQSEIAPDAVGLLTLLRVDE